MRRVLERVTLEWRIGGGTIEHEEQVAVESGDLRSLDSFADADDHVMFVNTSPGLQRS